MINITRSKSLKIEYRLLTTISLIILFTLILTGCKKKDTENPNTVSRPVKTIKIEDIPYKLSYYFPGKVRADQKTILSFQVKGRVINLPIRVGQKVKKGDLLAQLDSKNYKNYYMKCIANYKEAKIIYERADKLNKQDVISVEEYDTKLKNYQIAISKMKIAKKKYNDTSLYAPYSGIIAKRYIENYQEVHSKEPILILQDLDYLEIEIYVPGKHIIDFKRDNIYNCYAIFSSLLEKKFKLKLKEYDAIADPQTLSYKIIFRMKNPENLNILPGMTARVEVKRTIKQRKNKSTGVCT
jgi:membrane fusion protein, multidrug efflux system